MKAAEDGDLSTIKGWVGKYLNALAFILKHPAKAFGTAMFFIVGAYTVYAFLGKGVEFFPSVEPEFLQVQVQARGDLSIFERDQIVRQVESHVLDVDEIIVDYPLTSYVVVQKILMLI
mgnify:CR=1 FL=1